MNINEIAQLAGVSRATVSRYLNDGYVSAEKREKIRAVIEQTGYQPSSQAQTLRTKKTKLIGIILPKINSETISRMAAGVSEVLNKKGYQIILANTDNSIQEELKYLSLFKDNQVDGIIFIATIFVKKHLQLLKELKVPIVILGQYLEGYSCVYQDDYHAAKDLAKILLKQSKNVGYIGVTLKDKAAGYSRKKGFEDAFKEEKRSPDPRYMKEATFQLKSGYEKAKELLEEFPEVDALFCATDNLAIGALIYLREQGRKVPGEIQVTGTGDIPMGQIVVPKLTTVHYYYKTSGKEAASMLVGLLESEEAIRKEIKMGYEIILRDTTKNE